MSPEHRIRELERLWETSPTSFIGKRGLLKRMAGYTDEEIDEVIRRKTMGEKRPVKIPKF